MAMIIYYLAMYKIIPCHSTLTWGEIYHECISTQRNSPYTANLGRPLIYENDNLIVSRKLSTKELMVLNCGVGEDS